MFAYFGYFAYIKLEHRFAQHFIIRASRVSFGLFIVDDISYGQNLLHV